MQQCPFCPSRVRQDRYRKHITRVHQGAAPVSKLAPLSRRGVAGHTPRTIAGEPATTDAAPRAVAMRNGAGNVAPSASRKEVKQCPYCPSKVREDRYEKHIGRVHQNTATFPQSPPQMADDFLPSTVEDNLTEIDLTAKDRRVDCDCGGEPTCVMCEGSGWFIEHYDGDFTPGSSS